jgi:hypothetical protein
MNPVTGGAADRARDPRGAHCYLAARTLAIQPKNVRQIERGVMKNIKLLLVLGLFAVMGLARFAEEPRGGGWCKRGSGRSRWR